MAIKKPDEFKNTSRLLSEDEKELIGVLKSFYENIDDLKNRVLTLEGDVATIYRAMGGMILTQGSKTDGLDDA
ncbi:MAG TPA: hypothetical protein VIY48_10630 [Candidatus Paceibacterota bacterium]